MRPSVAEELLANVSRQIQAACYTVYGFFCCETALAMERVKVKAILANGPLFSCAIGGALAKSKTQFVVANRLSGKDCLRARTRLWWGSIWLCRRNSTGPMRW